MQHQTPLSLIPGSWDELIARAALRVADWLHDLLRPRPAQPTTADRPLHPGS